MAEKRVRRAKVVDGAVLKDQVAISDIVLDSDVQPRESISSGTIGEYAEAMRDGAEFPEIVIYRDPETGLNVAADGWHRVMAAKEAGKATILAEIRPGTKRDAILYSVSANATHGLRRTNDDKRRAIGRLLDDEEWGRWSDNVIAQKVGVSQPTVSGMRKQREAGTASPTRIVRTSDGREMDTSRIGKHQVERAKQRKADAASQEPTPSNGHAPVALVPDADDGEQDEVPTLAPIVQAEEPFAARLVRMLVEMADSDAKTVVGEMDRDQLEQLADKWDGVIDAFNNYSDALEAALEATTTA